MSGRIAILAKAVARTGSAAVGWGDRLWNWLTARLPSRDTPREAVLVTIVVLYLVVNVARSALDKGIAKIHPLDVSGVSTNSLHDGHEAIETAFTTWNLGDERLGELVRFHPVTLAMVQTALELLLVPLTFVVFYGLNTWMRGRLAAGPGTPARNAVLTLMKAAALGVLGYTVLGLLNQVAELAVLVREDGLSPLDDVLVVTGGLRRLLMPFFLLPLGVAAIQIHRDRRSGVVPAPPPVWRGAPTSYRVLFVVVALHAVLVLVSIPGQQAADALRLWTATPLLALTGCLYTALLCTALATIALRIGIDANPIRAVLARRGTQRMIGIGFVLGLLGAWALYGLDRAVGAGILAAGLLVLAASTLSWPLAPATPGEPPKTAPTDEDLTVVEPDNSVKRLVPALLVMIPFTVLAISLVRASVPSMMDQSSNGGLITYALLAGALAVVGWCLSRAAAGRAFAAGAKRANPVLRRIEVALTLVIAVTYLAVVLGDTQRWSRDLGVIGIIATFLTAVVLVFGTIGYRMECRALPAVLDFVNFRRLPIVLSLLAWAVLSNQFAPSGYHDLERMDEALPEQPQLTAADAFDQWATANLADATSTEPSGDQEAVPMVFVAAAGGGIKAAAFTAAAFDCMFLGDDDPDDGRPCTGGDAYERLFAASGASGGSVGIASVLAERADGAVADDWVEDRLGNDLLSPELAWQVMVEVPNAILSIQPDRDRGAILTESWREAFADGDDDPGDAPFYTDRADGNWSGPLVFLSGTNLNDGCRVNISAVRSARASGGGSDQQPVPALATRSGACDGQRAVDGTGPDQAGTRDLVDYLCGRNVDLATAAFLSARFPFVSPTGTTHCPDDTEDGTDDPSTSDSLSIGDAGYRDNSGAGSIMDSWAAIEPMVAEFNASHDMCIVPVFVEINTGYTGFGAPTSESEVPQVLAPPRGAFNVFSDLSYGPIEQAAAEFSRPLAPDRQVRLGGEELATRFFRVTLVDHPGVTAALGWSLSDGAVGDLVEQLDLQENRMSLLGLRQILDPRPDQPLRCAAA